MTSSGSGRDDLFPLDPEPTGAEAAGPESAAVSDFAPEELAMLRSFFRDEAQEALDGLTSRLLQVGGGGPGPHVVTELMRITHTLKGSAGTVGMTTIVDYTHELEDHFARVGTGELPWSNDVHDQFIELVDALRGYVDALGEDATLGMLAERIASCFNALQQRAQGRAPKTSGESAARPGHAQVPEAPSGPLDRAPRGTPRGASRRAQQTKRRPRARPATEPPTIFDADHVDDTTRSIVADTSGDDIKPDDRGVLLVDPQRIDQLMDGFV